MLIYRLEHRHSGLGPFEHKSSRQKHPSQEVLRGLYTDAREFMPDVGLLPVTRNLLRRYPAAVFGWESMNRCSQMIKDIDFVYALGFRIHGYKRPALHVFPCGQVLFLKQESVDYATPYLKKRGEKWNKILKGTPHE